MGALLESGMVGNIGLKHLRVIKEDTIKNVELVNQLKDIRAELVAIREVL